MTNKQWTLYDLIYKALEKFPELRNNDIDLQIKIIEQTNDKGILRLFGGVYIEREAAKKVSQDSVKRIRAKIQNEERLFLPTDPKIRKSRGISEENWEKWILQHNFGYRI